MPEPIPEEEPFRKIRLTLSEDAIDKLENLRKQGSFRSDSMTVEECIRAIYSILGYIDMILKPRFKDFGKIEKFAFPEEDMRLLVELMIAKLDRFTRFTIRLPSTSNK